MKIASRILLFAAGMVLVLAVMFFGGGTALAQGGFAGGTGTLEDPWLIETPEQLARIAETVYSDSHFKLNTDIDLTGYLSEGGGGWNDGAGWEPVGTWIDVSDPGNPFTGSFDGGGHTISNLYINRDETEGVGLFGYTNGAVIKDVRLENADITGYCYVGSLVGYNKNSTIDGSSTDSVVIQGYGSIGGLVGYNREGTIINSNAAGNVTGTFYTIGGLAGSNALGEITNSYAEAVVQGDYMVGGLVGDNSNGSIESSYATGTVSDIAVPDPESEGYFGGLVGRNTYDGTITDSYATGNVDGTVYVGGLAGSNKDGGIITNSYATGDVTGANHVGGLVGFNFLDDYLFYDDPQINGCYARGAVAGTQYIGGLVGVNDGGKITQAYAAGAVTGTDYVGGLVGSNNSPITSITGSYYDSETTGSETGDGESKTTIQMQTPVTFIDWDFAAVWGINPEQNGGYPFFRWQAEYTDAQFAGGTGEAATPYQVAAPWQLNNARLYLDKHFILVADINLSTYLSAGGGGYNEGEGWEPVGTSENPFTGSFDGAWYAISNLLTDKPGTNYVGLFGYVGENGEIRNLGLDNVDVTGGDYVGGLAGFNYKGTITNSRVMGSVNGFDTIGGLTGQNQGTVTGCYAIVDVTGAQNAGGLSGLNFQSDIENSYAAGTANGDYYIGGLVGYNYSSGSITNSYATVVVEGNSSVAGLGVNDDGTITSSFWDTQTSGQSGASGGTGKTTAEMKQQTTFTGNGWDFDNIWEINVGTYPYLSWQTDNYDFAPPVFASVYPQADNVTHNALDLLLQIDENATACYVVLSDEAAAPTAAQVRAGTGADDEVLDANRKGSIGLTTGTEETVSITGLEPETSYHIYVTAEDAAGNLQPDLLMAMTAVTTIEASDTTVNIAAIPGVTPPATGGVPVTTINETEQYTGTISWEPDHDPIQGETVYTAVITLTAKEGFTFNGVAAGFFTVAGAETVTNEVNSGVVTAVFPETAAVPETQYITVTSTGPVNGATGVSLTPTVTITFSENIEADSSYGGITMKNAGGGTVGISKSISGKVLTITPDSSLSYSTTYTVTVPVAALKSTATGANLEEQYQISFTVRSAPSGGSGGSRSSTPVYNAAITGGSASGTGLSIDVSTRPGSAVVNLGEQAGDILDGEGITVITVPTIPGVNNYTLEIPGSSLSGTLGENILTFSTDSGSITIPDNMLSGTGLEDKGDIGITIGEGDKSGLPDYVRDDIGDRPIIRLTLTLNQEQTDWNNSDARVTVSIPYQPTADELANPEHITIWYIDGAGNVVEMPNGRYDPGTGTVTFSTTHFSRYAVVYVTKTFDDLESAVWAKKPIEVLASKGILKGISEKEYAPQTNITRADFLYYLVRTLGVDARVDGNFDDISRDAYYYKEIGIAKKLGITHGTGNNKFSPDESITRLDMMVLAERALRMLEKLEVQGTASDLDRFADKSLIADYASDSIASVVREGLIVGSGDRLNPLGHTTRAEAAAFLYRIYNKY
ncbi:GLUG motif-containing protein [Phosphitispora fastidiosa]|uniref:GLUG motif-containing protein n=1 Tax=Phosphitispora fastidiosa TaxID=2837202 RepID=UPI001E5AD462|nr:GLUG motif-containing protein [Phosphitispora fastidiosa]MBU7005957.1 hypothetical protein [Phosphitispora fastidiosa]